MKTRWCLTYIITWPKISIEQKANMRIQGCVAHSEVSNEDDEVDEDDDINI